MTGLGSWVTWRAVVGAVLLWMADRALDLCEWLQNAADRLEAGRRPPERGMVRLAYLCVLAGVSLATGFAYGYRGTPEHPGVEAARPSDPVQAQESTGEVLYWVVRGCSEGGGRWVQGIEDGVLVGHCTPAALPHLGVVAVPPPARPTVRFPATATTRAPEERGSVHPVRGERSRAGASAGRAGAGVSNQAGGIE